MRPEKNSAIIAYCGLDKRTFEVIVLWNSDLEGVPCQSARTLVKIQAARMDNDLVILVLQSVESITQFCLFHLFSLEAPDAPKLHSGVHWLVLTRTHEFYKVK